MTTRTATVSKPVTPKAKGMESPAIVKALLAGEKNDLVIQKLILSAAAQVVKHGNTIGFAKDIVIPLLGFEQTKGTIDRQGLILGYVQEVCQMSIDKDALKVTLKQPKEFYTQDWWNVLKAKPWCHKVASAKEWHDPAASVESQYATGLLMLATAWSDLSDDFTVKKLTAINAQVNNKKLQAKITDRCKKLGIPMADVGELNRMFLDATQGSVMMS